MAASPSRPSVSPLTPTLVGLTLGLSGCPNDDEPCELSDFEAPDEPKPTTTSPPMVIDGEWIGAGVLELTFSEPLQAGSPPDPSRFAVLGWSVVVQEQYNYYGSSTTCQELTRYALLGQGYYGRATVTDAWVAPEDPTLLRLRLSNTGATCSIQTGLVEQGVMLVYTNGAAGGTELFDAAGDPLTDIGPAWAIPNLDNCLGYSGNYYCGYSLNQNSNGQLPSTTSLALIPCP